MAERTPQALARRVLLKAYLCSDGITPATGKTLTVTISKNGGAFGNPSAGATAASEIGNGWYYVDLSTTDFGTMGPVIVRGTGSGVDDVEREFEVVDAHNAGFDYLDVAVSTRLAAAGYTAPASAVAIASQVRTELATELGRIDAAISTRLAAAGYTAPDNTGIAAIVSALVGVALEASLQTVLTRLGTPAVSVAADIAAVPTAAENADGLLARNIAGGSNGGRTVTDALRPLRNRVDTDETGIVVYQEDDTTEAWSGTVTRASLDPMTSVNPG